MKRIYKYQLAVDDVQEIEMPAGARPIAVQVQHDTPYLWAIVNHDSNNSKMNVAFRTYGTGHQMDDLDEYPAYVGTYQLKDGMLVFHVFTNAFVDRK